MCGVSVLCIAATGGRVGGMGVCVWRPPCKCAMYIKVIMCICK